MKSRKYWRKIHKRDNVDLLETKYLVRVNDGDLLEFDDKLKLAEWLENYRLKYNEIREISMFKMQLYNLINL